MKVVDAHTHVPAHCEAAASGEAAGHEMLEMCDRYGVDGAWVFTNSGLNDPAPAHNDAVVRFCAADPLRLQPFCTVFPHLPGAVQELHRAVELGARGLKLHPWLQGFSPLDPCMDELGRAALELDIPIVFHDGTPPYSSPLQVAYFAERNVGVPVLLGHAGLHDLWTEAMVAVQRVPNLWWMPSGTPVHGLRRMVETVGTERMVFGSDAGYGDPHWQPFQLKKLRDLHLDIESEAAALGGNAMSLVGPRC
jgi:predicted TIM-barrel fold metal-dependent hydrolase